MKTVLRRVLGIFVTLSLLTGIVYPLLITAVGQGLFPRQANGSVIERSSHAVGSTLIGQPFAAPEYFWGRLSGTTPQPYNGASSTATNLGPSNPALAEAIEARLHALHEADPGNARPVPIDLLTASASGLDPHISPAAADYQLERVARARALPVAQVRAQVAAHTEGRTFGVLGEARVNVLELNLALDALRN